MTELVTRMPAQAGRGVVAWINRARKVGGLSMLTQLPDWEPDAREWTGELSCPVARALGELAGPDDSPVAVWGVGVEVPRRYADQVAQAWGTVAEGRFVPLPAVVARYVDRFDDRLERLAEDAEFADLDAQFMILTR